MPRMPRVVPYKGITRVARGVDREVVVAALNFVYHAPTVDCSPFERFLDSRQHSLSRRTQLFLARVLHRAYFYVIVTTDVHVPASRVFFADQGHIRR